MRAAVGMPPFLEITVAGKGRLGEGGRTDAGRP